MKTRCGLFAVIWFVIGSSCSQRKTLSIAELIEYAANTENGLVKANDSNDVYVKVAYRPRDIVLDQLIDGVEDSLERSKIERQCDTIDYFSMSLSLKGTEIENHYASNPSKLNELMNYFEGEIDGDIFLTYEKDTLRPLDARYQRTFGASQSTGIMVAFKAAPINEVEELIFNFRSPFLGVEGVRLQYRADDIKRIPRLKK